MAIGLGRAQAELDGAQQEVLTSHPARLRDAASMYAHRRRRQQLAATLPTGKRSHAPVYHERTAPRLIGHCANLPHKLAPDQKINATAVLRAATRQDARTRIRRRPDHDGVSTTPRIGNSAPSVDPAHTHSHAPPELATCQVHTTCTHRTTTPIASTPRASRVEFAVASKVRDAPLTWSPFSASSCHGEEVCDRAHHEHDEEREAIGLGRHTIGLVRLQGEHTAKEGGEEEIQVHACGNAFPIRRKGRQKAAEEDERAACETAVQRVHRARRQRAPGAANDQEEPVGRDEGRHIQILEQPHVIARHPYHCAAQCPA
eukprot:CAMPEP_0119420024 /NCGR_PEP_ID=MMETSP1335-20130426/22426_1 /TAXON_ID=259385 /ORGANISM="Chrysoculter rhomboideus, Strain RCC1486" /LENGTH=315 /DNA_ID=CAMNT_0007445359 /DNA_START=227 /DNA_END=1173 /DNA_ORIENTATION=-